MKVADILTLTIQDQGIAGEGIAKQDDYVIFVPQALVGETVEAKVTYCKRNLVYTTLCRVLVPSAHREQAACPHFGACGGCDYLHADYAYQLQAKTKAVATTLAKAKVQAAVADCVPCSTPFGYRNKIMLPFGMVKGKIAVGFYRKNTHTIVPIEACPLHNEWAATLIRITLAFASKYNLSAYDSTTGKGLLRHLVARYLDGHIDVTLVATAQVPHTADYARMLAQSFGQYALYLCINRQNNNVIMGTEVRLLSGQSAMVRFEGITCSINPLSFLQVNDEICAAIYRQVCRIVDAQKGAVVIDAFAGIGLLGAVMAKAGATVYNIEIVPQAVQDAERLAKANDLTLHCTVGDSAKQLPALLEYLCQAAPAVHTMRLLPPYWNAIRSGAKRYEIRRNDEKRQGIQDGDLIAFVYQKSPHDGGENDPQEGQVVFAKVVGKQVFPTLPQLVSAIPVEQMMPAGCDSKTALNILQSIYPQSDKDGFVAIEIRPVSVRGVSVVLDPPRKGCPDQVIASLCSLATRGEYMSSLAAHSVPVGEIITLPYIDKLVYISCNPATLARDLAMLQTQYAVSSVTPYDMFPNTQHVETVVQLTRRAIQS